MKKTNLILWMIAGLFLYCEPAPEEIQFGEEACAYCSMGIVDPVFAAEIVTGKGKVYKYDSIECMVRSYQQMEEPVSMILVMNYDDPGTFLSAKEAQFLKSSAIRSPMGAQLAAFKNEESILRNGFGGSVFDWEALVQHVN